MCERVDETVKRRQVKTVPALMLVGDGFRVRGCLRLRNGDSLRSHIACESVRRLRRSLALGCQIELKHAFCRISESPVTPPHRGKACSGCQFPVTSCAHTAHTAHAAPRANQNRNRRSTSAARHAAFCDVCVPQVANRFQRRSTVNNVGPLRPDRLQSRTEHRKAAKIRHAIKSSVTSPRP